MVGECTASPNATDPAQPTPSAAAAESSTMGAEQEADRDFADLGNLPRSKLRKAWLGEFGKDPPACFGRELLALGIAYARQERRYGGFRKTTIRELDRLFARVLSGVSVEGRAPPFGRPGTVLVREWNGI